MFQWAGWWIARRGAATDPATGDPCSWLQRTTPPGTLRALVHRGGLRADILTSGVIRIGDSIQIDGDPAAVSDR